MGIARKLGKILSGSLFTTFLVFAILVMSLIQFTEYNALKPVFTDILSQQITSSTPPEELDRLHAALSAKCKNSETVDIPMENQNISVKCSEIENSKPKDLTKLVAVKTFDDMYYKQYDCKFIECVQKGEGSLFIILSAHANNFFKTAQVYLWVLTFIFGALLILSIETWADRLKGVGTSLILTALPFFFLNYLADFFVPKGVMQSLPPQVANSVNNLIGQLVNSTFINYLIVFVIGVILVSGGYILDYRLKKQKMKK
jgi:hypothetical protein